MLINNKKLYSLILFLSIFLQSCAPTLPTVKNYKKDDIPLPESFPHYNRRDKDHESSKEDASSADKNWKEFFKDKNLKILIETALKNNQELNILQQEINISNNEVMARKGEYIPNLGFKAGYESEKVGEFTSQGVSDKTHTYEVEENGKMVTKEVPEVLHNHKIGLYSSWEIDIWKKLRNATKAAYYRYLSSVEGQKFMITRLVSEVANSYYELMALDKQLEIVNNYIKVLKEAQSLVEYQQKAAKVTSLAVKRFSAEVYKNRSHQFEIEQKIILTENKINILVGRFPQPVERASKSFRDLIPRNIKSGIPSELLENRPDVKKASLALKASKLDLKVAKARFYPALSIEAGAGYEAFNKEHLYEAPQSIFYNLGVNLTAPLLNRQAIKADYFSANNLQIQAVYKYERTLIKAYTEVANQLSMISNLEKIYSLKKKEVEAMTQSVSISRILFKAARVDYVEALMTQRDSLEAQVELIEIKKEQLVSYVNLYKAIGGGWKHLKKKG